MSVCWAPTTSTWVTGCAARNSRTTGMSSGTVAAFTVPTRTIRLIRCCSPAAERSRSTASSTPMMCGRSSRPDALMVAPDRLRSRRSTPSSRSRFRTVSLNAGWESRSSSAARRSEPSRVTAAMYSSCSVRTTEECGLVGRPFKGFPVTPS